MVYLISVGVFFVVVFVHEFGHFIVAKMCGLKVPVFSIGFGPRLCGIVWKGTDYRIAPIPLGGFVSIPELEDETMLEATCEEPASEEVRKPGDVPAFAKLATLIAGPAANAILTFVVCVFYFGSTSDFVGMISEMFDVLNKLFITREVGPSHLAGPLGIFDIGAQSASLGLEPLMKFIAFLSINLAILNLLPIPILDGGRILMVTFEAIIRKPINETVKSLMMNGSVILMLLLFAYVTINDIIRKSSGSSEKSKETQVEPEDKSEEGEQKTEGAQSRLMPILESNTIRL